MHTDSKPVHTGCSADIEYQQTGGNNKGYEVNTKDWSRGVGKSIKKIKISK